MEEPVIARKDVNRRVAVAAAAFAAGALLLTGCSAGQVTQTSSQQAAVNGSSKTDKTVDLRNVRILAPSGAEYTNQSGGEALLAFVLVNSSPDQTLTLTGINSDVAGSVDIGEVKPIPPLASLKSDVAGATTVEGQTLITVKLKDLKKTLAEGPNYNVTFLFSNGMTINVPAPIDSEGHERYVPPAAPAPAEGEGGH
jgi:copper(I)-binding protein